MGSTYKIEKGIAVLTNSGSFSYRDVETTLRALAKDQDFRAGMGVLFIDKGSNYDPPGHEPKAAARMLSSFVPGISGRIAIVVSTDLHFGIARMIQAHCEAHEVTFKVFREEHTARMWLTKGAEQSHASDAQWRA